MGQAASNGPNGQFTNVPAPRKLGAFERWFSKFAEMEGMTFTMTTATFETPVTLSELQDAATELQKCHPMLQAIVQPVNDEETFIFGAARAVKVRHYECTLGKAIDDEMCNVPNKQEIGWNIALCGSTVLLTYHHSFLDGVSVMVLLKDLLNELSGGIMRASDSEVPKEPWGGWSSDPTTLLPSYKALNPGEQVPFVGRWVPGRRHEWKQRAAAYYPGTRHHWSADNSCEWTTGPATGTAQILGKTADKNGDLFIVKYCSERYGVNGFYGTIRMLSEDEYYLSLDVHFGMGEYMKRATSANSACFDWCKHEYLKRAQASGRKPFPCQAVYTIPGMTFKAAERLEPECRSPNTPGACWRQLSEDNTTRLLARCRAEHVTMQGAVAAAVARANVRVAGKTVAQLNHIAQTREARGVGSQFVGSCVGWVGNTVDAAQPFWEIARSTRMKLVSSMAHGAHLRAMDIAPSPQSPPQQERHTIRQKTKLPDILNISNRGSFDLETASHRLSNIHVMQRLDSLISFVSVNGALSIDISFNKASYDTEVWSKFADWLSLELECAADE